MDMQVRDFGRFRASRIERANREFQGVVERFGIEHFSTGLGVARSDSADDVTKATQEI
jgi:hypothetical protein